MGARWLGRRSRLGVGSALGAAGLLTAACAAVGVLHGDPPAAAPAPGAPAAAAAPAPVAAGPLFHPAGGVDAPLPEFTDPVVPATPAADKTLAVGRRITGDLAPKSVIYGGAGRFFAQNMMYRHTVSVYGRAGDLVATIPDTVRLADLGHPDLPGEYRGAPVEAALSADGRHVYVSNYQMYGPGFGRPGNDECGPSGWDESFVYRIDVASLAIDQAIRVGAVPKYVATTPDGRYVLVTNWCSYDLSVVDVATAREVQRIRLGAFPRGIDVTSDSRVAYVAVMGSRDVAVVSLSDFAVGWIRNVGGAPRHAVLSPDDRFLYVSLNADGRLAKVDVTTGAVVARIATGDAPRSMDISTDGTALYVVNYDSGTVSKVRTADMSELQELPVAPLPIGIAYDPETHDVWVASYSGVLTVMTDS